MSTKTTIIPATSADISALTDLVYASKLSLTINRLLYKDWPNSSAQRSNNASTIENSLKDPSIESFKAINETGDVLGYAVFTRKRPVANAPPIPSQEGVDVDKASQDVPDFFTPHVLATVIEGITELNAVMEGKDHFEITFIVVERSNRGSGIGSQLVRVGLEKARAEGIPFTINCEPAAYEFFLKMGFQDTKHFEMDLSKWAPPYTGFGPFRLFGMVWYP